MVDNLWAMTMVVLSFMASSMASWINFSEWESRLEVASSSTKIFEFSSKALAIAILCLSHPDSFTHLSQTKVSYQCLSLHINS